MIDHIPHSSICIAARIHAEFPWNKKKQHPPVGTILQSWMAGTVDIHHPPAEAKRRATRATRGRPP